MREGDRERSDGGVASTGVAREPMDRLCIAHAPSFGAEEFCGKDTTPPYAHTNAWGL